LTFIVIFKQEDPMLFKLLMFLFNS